MAILCPRCSSEDLVSSANAAGFECLSCRTMFTATLSAAHAQPMDTDEFVAAFKGAATGDEPTRIGQRVGAYRIDAVLGKGGMGIVYRAVHEQLQRVVALKMVRDPGLDDPASRSRFLIEARAVARLQHPHIVQIFEVGEAEGSPFLALELADGGTLADLLEYGPLKAGKAASMIRQVAVAVEIAHRAGVIHRDLKPANILLTAEGLPKVSDFGLAKQIDDPGLTRTGAILGTPSYMAPEQSTGAALPAAAAADIYALGGILYAATTGRPPFQGSSALETIEQLRNRAPVSPRTLVPTLPRDLETITLKCLQKEPGRRYATARELAEDLDRFLGHRPIVAKPVSAFERTHKWIRRNPAPAALVATAVLVPIAALLAWTGYRENQFRLLQQQLHEQALRTSMGDKLATALEEMHAFIDASQWQPAFAAAERATSVAIEGVDPDLAETAARYYSDLAMIVELEQIWQQQIRVLPAESAFHYVDSRADYDALFRRYGFHAETLSAAQAGARLEHLPDTMREAVIVALEDWMFVALPAGPDDTTRWVVETLQTSDPSPWRRSMRAAITGRDLEQILALLDEPEAVEQNPQSLRIVGAILKMSGRYDIAHRLFQDSHARNPGNLWSNHSLAMLLVEMDPPQWEESLRYFAGALALAPDNAGIMVNMAISHSNLGEHEQAEALFREAVRLEPEYAAAHYNLGRCLSDQGDRAGAIAAYQRAIGILPGYASAHMNLGIELAAQGSHQAALASYDRAVELEPENPDSLNARAMTLNALGRRGEAIAELTKAIELAPSHANANLNLARLYSASGDIEQAEAVYRRVIELTPDQHGAYYGLASMLGKNGRDEEAIELFREAIRLRPTHAETWCNYSDALQDAGHFAEALEAITEGHRLGSATADWPYPSAQWLQETAAMAELEARMESVLNGEEELEDALTKLHFARMLRIKKRFADAARAYRDAFAAEPVQADDLAAGHRYWAAHCAAQAGGNPELSDEQRGALCTQACQWLAADLQLRRQALRGTVEDRQDVEEKLHFWLDDEGLAAIRDEARVAMLPAAVQETCRQLWKDVRDLLAELSGRP